MFRCFRAFFIAISIFILSMLDFKQSLQITDNLPNKDLEVIDRALLKLEQIFQTKQLKVFVLLYRKIIGSCRNPLITIL